jgi:hypothetical protein
MLDELSKERVKHLCDLIAKEQDHQRFSVLVAELNDLLDGCDSGRKDGDGSPSSSFKTPS